MSDPTLEAFLKSRIRDVPDFPKPGILFKDITPLLGDAAAFSATIDALAERLAAYRPQALVSIESRGFIFGAALALRLKLPFLPVRKPGKLPWRTEQVTYQLEYGEDRLEMHADALVAGTRCAIVDDVLATGGTAEAAVQLVRRFDGEVVACGFLMELGFLNGRPRLAPSAVESLLIY